MIQVFASSAHSASKNRRMFSHILTSHASCRYVQAVDFISSILLRVMCMKRVGSDNNISASCQGESDIIRRISYFGSLLLLLYMRLSLRHLFSDRTDDVLAGRDSRSFVRTKHFRMHRLSIYAFFIFARTSF